MYTFYVFLKNVPFITIHRARTNPCLSLTSQVKYDTL